jgi:hypothetical protein
MTVEGKPLGLRVGTAGSVGELRQRESRSLGGGLYRRFQNLATTRYSNRRRFDGIAIKVGTVCTDLFPVPHTMLTAGQGKQTGQHAREPIYRRSNAI